MRERRRQGRRAAVGDRMAAAAGCRFRLPISGV